MADIDIEKLKNDRDGLRQQLSEVLAQYHQIEGAISALSQLIETLESIGKEKNDS